MSIKKFTSTSTTFTVNGQTYASLDEMPPDVRRDFEEMMRKLTTDRDGNGIPDLFENAPGGPAQKSVVITKRTIVDGKEIDRVDDLPPEVRNALSASVLRARPGPLLTWLYFISVIVAILLIAAFVYRLISKNS